MKFSSCHLRVFLTCGRAYTQIVRYGQDVTLLYKFAVQGGIEPPPGGLRPVSSTLETYHTTHPATIRVAPTVSTGAYVLVSGW